MENGNSRSKDSLWKSGHWPTLVSAFLYFDFSFMVWTVLGPLGLRDDRSGLGDAR